MTFGDFTESELEARNLAKRVNDIKSQFKDLSHTTQQKQHRRMSSDDGSELEVQSFTLSNSQISGFKSSLMPIKPMIHPEPLPQPSTPHKRTRAYALLSLLSQKDTRENNLA